MNQSGYDMDLALFESQGPEFVVVSDDRGRTFCGFGGSLGIRSGALAPPWAVAIRHLRYREDSISTAFRPLFADHRREQAQVVMFDGERAAPWLEVADGAIPVQDKGWRLPATPSSPDRLNGLARPGDVVSNPHGSVTVASAVDQCSGVC